MPGTSRRTIHVSARLPREVCVRLDAWAQERDRTRSAAIALLLRAALEEHREEKDRREAGK